MTKKQKSSRKKMAGRIGKRYTGQVPGGYMALNSKQEDVLAANRASRRRTVALRLKALGIKL